MHSLFSCYPVPTINPFPHLPSFFVKHQWRRLIMVMQPHEYHLWSPPSFLLTRVPSILALTRVEELIYVIKIQIIISNWSVITSVAHHVWLLPTSHHVWASQSFLLWRCLPPPPCWITSQRDSTLCLTNIGPSVSISAARRIQRNMENDFFVIEINFKPRFYPLLLMDMCKRRTRFLLCHTA